MSTSDWLLLFVLAVSVAALVMSIVALSSDDSAPVVSNVTGLTRSDQPITFDNGTIVPNQITLTSDKLITDAQVRLTDFTDKTQNNLGNLATFSRTLTYTPSYYDPVSIVSGKTHEHSELRMTLVRGFPYIVYFDSANNDLYGLRCQDTLGKEWGTPVLIVDNAVITNYNVIASSTKVIVVYTVGTDIFSLASSDVFGDTWASSAVTLGDTADNTEQLGAAIVNGLPTFVWTSTVDNTVSMIQATTSDASAYGSISTVAVTNASRANLVNRNNVLEVVAVSDTGDRIKYIVSTDNAGTTFETTVDIDVGAIDVGDLQLFHTSDNKPAIMFYDATNNFLKVAVSSTTDGLTDSDWSVNTVRQAGSEDIGSRFTVQFVNSGNSVPRATALVWNDNKIHLEIVQSTSASLSDWTAYTLFQNNQPFKIGERVTSVLSASGAMYVAFADDDLHDSLRFINLQHSTDAVITYKEG